MECRKFFNDCKNFWRNILTKDLREIFGKHTDAPFGYLRCDGSRVSKVQYKDLYGVIGDSYGTSSYISFVLPDFTIKIKTNKKVATTKTRHFIKWKRGNDVSVGTISLIH